MKPSSNLFDLIKSLSKSEKGYFRKYCSLHMMQEKNNYLRLFEVIDSLPVYNEKLVRKKLGKENISKNIHVYKNYLYNLILKSLVRYYNDKHVNAQIMELLQHVEILYDKALYPHCHKILQKAKKLATEYEKFSLLNEVLNWEIRLVMAWVAVTEVSDTLNEIKSEKENVRARMKNSDDYLLDHHQVFLIQRRWSSGSENLQQDMESCNAILSAPYYQNEDCASTFLSKCSYHFSMMRRNMLERKMQDAYESQKKILQLFLDHPHQIVENASAYFNVVFDTVFAKHFIEENGTKGQVELELLRDKLKTENRIQNSINFGILIFIKEAEYQLMLCEMNRDYSRVKQVAKEYQAGLDFFGEKIPQARSLANIYTIATLFFYNKQYKDALAWINKIIDIEGDFYRSLKATIRVFYLMIHYELGNHELLRYRIRSTKRFLSREGLLTEVEKLMIEQLARLLTYEEKEMQMAVLVSLNQKMNLLLAEKEKYPQLEYLDYFGWMEMKIQDLKKNCQRQLV